jgi:UDP-N-acetylglucosamine diphosphorylase/glucosamine-1-phosphate N-acetyltransferase
MKIVLTETESSHQNLLPLTYTRSIGALRVGILTIAEKWAHHMGAEVFHETTHSLQSLYPITDTCDLRIDARVLPSESLVMTLGKLKEQQAVYHQGEMIASRGTGDTGVFERIDFEQRVDLIRYSWDIFRLNGQEIRSDFKLITTGRQSQALDDKHTITYGENIFIETGAKVKAAILNAENGPIYIGKSAEVQEGSIIRGPFSLGEASVVNMGAKIRGDSTIGPYSKAGGEISNSVIFGYSNKGHDGFLGNSVIGEWCNIGADTNNSNLKNNYAEVKMWNYASERFIKTGLQFCGMIMGDHSKCGINTMINTGTTIGVSANVFGEGFPRNIIPSFAWGGTKGFITYKPQKAFETARLVMERRGKTLSESEEKVLLDIFDQTSDERHWEK